LHCQVLPASWPSTRCTPNVRSHYCIYGEAAYLDALPPVVTIPITTFNDKQMWPNASNAILQTANPTNTLLQPDGVHTILTTCIIPLPPHLVPTMLEHAHDNLPMVMQILKQCMTQYSPQTSKYLHFQCNSSGQLALQLQTQIQPQAIVASHSHQSRWTKPSLNGQACNTPSTASPCNWQRQSNHPLPYLCQINN